MSIVKSNLLQRNYCDITQVNCFPTTEHFNKNREYVRRFDKKLISFRILFAYTTSASSTLWLHVKTFECQCIQLQKAIRRWYGDTTDVTIGFRYGGVTGSRVRIILSDKSLAARHAALRAAEVRFVARNNNPGDGVLFESRGPVICKG